mmetsp:Transcript_6014/g.15328  ORF Transcript_6014/g.15328 Transcript_6014/m.15328 type:complete len:210 (-) Transcript_6014:44-673(-)
MMGHTGAEMDEQFDGIFERGGAIATHAAGKRAVQKAYQKMKNAVFHGSVSDHLPVRMQVLLPEASEAVVSGEVLPDMTGALSSSANTSHYINVQPVQGVNIRASTARHTTELSEYGMTASSGSASEKLTVDRAAGKRLATKIMGVGQGGGASGGGRVGGGASGGGSGSGGSSGSGRSERGVYEEKEEEEEEDEEDEEEEGADDEDEEED